MKIQHSSSTHSIPQWVQDAIFYEIFPDRFCNGVPPINPKGVVPWESPPTRDNFFGGDLKGIINKLPYLEDLGVTALYLTPIFKAQTNHKYDVCDYLEIDPAFGTTETLRELVSKAHNRGIRIILDIVYNHSGFEFWAFKDVRRKGSSSKYADWFFIESYPIQTDPPNYKTFYGACNLPKLDTNNPELRDYLLNVATYWINKCGIDGWRLDTPYKLSMDFWRAFREKVKKAKPEAYIVGEVWRYHHLWLKGDTVDGVMNYPLREHILAYLIDGWMDSEDFDFENYALRDLHGPHAPYQMNLLGSHDTPRILTLSGDDVDRVILAISFLFTYIGAPMVYYGDEIGLRGNGDPDCRRTMNWDESTWEQKIYRAYKQLIHARHDHPALRSDVLETLYSFEGIYAYLRRYETDEVVVVLNPRKDYRNIKIPLKGVKSPSITWRDLLSGIILNRVDDFLLIDKLLSKTVLLLTPAQ